mgnify:CR=1 FL=1
MPTREILRQKLLDTPLFAEKIWKLSPEPWALTEAQLRDLKRIGAACLSYHRALERLYVRSFTNKKILRNREVYAPWVAEYLDRYKPAGLVAHGRHRAVKHQCPVVLRPDLLITEQGFTMTELDSVPGGVGLTAYLNEVYAEDFPSVIGANSMPDRFMASLARLTPKDKFPLVAIVVSDEAATYRPEFEWLGEKLRHDWMSKFIAGQIEYKPRPWLIARMPGFAHHADSLALGLNHQHGLPQKEADEPAADAEKIANGQKLVGADGGFNCITCHAVGEQEATAVFEAPAINFAESAERLRKGYYHRWVLAPTRIDPDTKMPKYADPEGVTQLSEPYEGKGPDQFEAIRQYIKSVK